MINTQSQYFVVLGVILLSGSLYYSTFGTNKLLIPFLVILLGLFVTRNSRLLMSTKHVLFIVFSLLVVFLNFNYATSSAGVFVLNLMIAILVYSLIPLAQFAKVYIRIIIVLSVFYWLSIPMIIIGIPSPLPNFNALGDASYVNYLFFGVVQSVFDAGVVARSGGIFWEPGAFMIFVNLAFILAITYGLVNKKSYAIFLITNLLLNSTTGLVVFTLLSVGYFSKNPKYLTPALILGIIIISAVGIQGLSDFLAPNIEKFQEGSSSYSSFAARSLDYWVDWNILKAHPFLGGGIGNLALREQYGFEITGLKTGFPGADGLFYFIASVGLFGAVMLFPLVFPRYLRREPIICKSAISLSIILMFSNENMSPYLISWVMVMYGLTATETRAPVTMGYRKYDCSK